LILRRNGGNSFESIPSLVFNKPPDESGAWFNGEYYKEFGNNHIQTFEFTKKYFLFTRRHWLTGFSLTDFTDCFVVCVLPFIRNICDSEFSLTLKKNEMKMKYFLYHRDE